MIPTRQALTEALRQAFDAACAAGDLQGGAAGGGPAFWVQRAAAERGEFASNLALAAVGAGWKAPVTAAPAAGALDAVARTLRQHLPAGVWPGSIEVAKGYLNFRMSNAQLAGQVERAVREGARYGAGSSLQGRRINVEFVSADPTGPLPFAMGRIAVGGDALCRLLEFQGADVTREFFLNDIESSPKLRLVGESVAAYYLEAFGRAGERPEGALTGDFVREVAAEVVRREGNAYLLVPDDERAAYFAHQAREAAVRVQRETLQELGVPFDVWTSESMLRTEGRVQRIVERLQAAGHTYEKEGALWLRTSAFGDEADRPLVRANGAPTYLAADIAYHVFKFERGFDLLLNIWTAQHRPYVVRTRAALRASNCDADRLEVVVSEGAMWLRDGVPISNGSDGGLLSLQETLREIDKNTLRFWLLLRDWDDVVEIDIETARRDDERNPAYAALLVPSRLETMIGELRARAGSAVLAQGVASAPSALAENVDWGAAERELLRLIALWPDEAETAALRRQPQRVARFVTEFGLAVRQLLAESRPSVEGKDGHLLARLHLLHAAKVTITNALGVLGIEVPERY